MPKKTKVRVSPVVHAHHDLERYLIEVQLPGLNKKDVHFEISKKSFLVQAARTELEYYGCYVLGHEVNADKAKAKFRNGLLTVSVPLAKPFKPFKGTKVEID